jgi:hypothetical protein
MHLSVSGAGWRRALGRYLLALLLLFTNAGLLPLLAQMVPECGAQCCRNKKTCCCRKQVRQGKGEAKVLARACPPGCGATATAGSGPVAGGLVGLMDEVPSTGDGVGGIVLWFAAGCWLVRFALHQRPPPPLFRFAIRS